jgi:hypothetical protein
MQDNLTAELLKTRRDTLFHLEQQRAAMGIQTPPYILMEIAQATREIERLMSHSYVYMLRREVLAHERPERRPGAILLVSPEQAAPEQKTLQQAAFEAIDYHRAALRHCWLIATTGEHGSLGAAEWLAHFCQARGIAAQVWQVAEASSVEETYNLVQWLYTVEVPASGLQAHEVVADITGATKPMSIGMLLACRGRGPVQYMVRQAQGPSLPLLLQLALPDASPGVPESES